jgi:peptide/nickel transport system substrate-binding protein
MKRGGMRRRDLLKASVAVAAGGALAAPAVWSPARAAPARNETLLLVTENGPNNLDIQGVGTNRPGYEASWNCYDRLIRNATKTLPDGTQVYDRDKLDLELAEDMKVDDMSVTFKLKKNATFQDGKPITAKDVKWSFDRAVTVGGFPTAQMQAGSLNKPEQFVAVDDQTFRVDFVQKDRLTLPDIAVIVPGIYNSELVKQHATAADPWGLEYTKSNTAGSGPYKVVSWKPGVELIYERNEGWVGGTLPELKRIIWRTIPSPGNRRALMERGDADISFDLPAKDFSEMKQAGKVKIISTPISNGMYSVEMNVKEPPFNNEKLRQALAYAMPYQKIMDAAMFGLAKPLFGGASNQVASIEWPQPTGYVTDLAKAKALMKEAGVGDGLSTTLSFDLGDGVTCQPIAELVQESLGQIGIQTTINKIPGSNWRSEMAKKSMPLMVNFFSGWLDYPEYFFFWCYHGANRIFNTPSYQSKDMDALIDGARQSIAVGDSATYSKDVEGFISQAYTEVPRIPLCQPNLSVATQPNISGYTYWFHRQLDYRSIRKA